MERSFKVKRRCPRCHKTFYNLVMWFRTPKQRIACSDCGHTWKGRLKKEETE